jgi:hypothetical protein
MGGDYASQNCQDRQTDRHKGTHKYRQTDERWGIYKLTITDMQATGPVHTDSYIVTFIEKLCDKLKDK